MSQVLVVGSDATYIRDTLSPKLQDLGIQVAAHWHWGSRPKRELPEGVEGVLVFPAEASARLSQAGRALGRQANVPVVEVGRQFSQFVPAIRAALGTQEPPEEETSGTAEGDLYMRVLAFFKGWSPKKDLPSLADTQANLREAVGLSDLVVPESIYKAAAAVARPAEAAKKKHQEMVEWVKFLIEDNPEMAEAEIATDVAASFNTAGATQEEILAAVRDGKKELWAAWTTHPKVKTAAELKHFKELREKWLRKYTMLSLQQTGELPSYDDTRKAMRRLFGACIQDRDMKVIRLKVWEEFDKALAEAATPKPEPKPTAEPKPTTAEAVLQQEIADLRSRITVLAKERDTLSQALGIEQEGAKALRESVSWLTADKAKLEAQAKKTKDTAGQWVQREKELQQQVDDLTEQNEMLRTERDTTDQKLQMMTAAFDEAQATNARLTDEARTRGMTLDDLIRLGCSITVTPMVGQSST